MSKPIIAFAAVLIASALVLPTVSQAQEFNSADEPNSMVVSYADLNLSALPAQVTLRGRIVHAAHEVCVYDETADVAFNRLLRSCRTGAVAQAEPAYQAAIAAARHGTVTVIDSASLIVTAP
jgi:UrcA family protein